MARPASRPIRGSVSTCFHGAVCGVGGFIGTRGITINNHRRLSVRPARRQRLCRGQRDRRRNYHLSNR